MIVPDKVAHQDVDDVVINWDCFAEARHFERMKEEGRRMK
jgi:hypothetical protein